MANIKMAVKSKIERKIIKTLENTLVQVCRVYFNKYIWYLAPVKIYVALFCPTDSESIL